jgi:hypothetical protein
MRDRRFDLRSAGPLEGVVHWRTEAGVNIQASGLMDDLSASGARIRVNRPIPVRSRVDIVVRDKQLPATVRYCTRTGAEFVVGVEFHPGHQDTLQSLCQTSEIAKS